MQPSTHSSAGQAGTAALVARAQLLSQQDLEQQIAEPRRWLDITDTIAAHSAALISAGDYSEAESYLAQAHRIFDAVGLRGPCRAALSGLAHLALAHSCSASFDAIAPGELLKPFPLGHLGDPVLQAVFAGHELLAWAGTMQAASCDRELIEKLSQKLGSLLSAPQIRWREAPSSALATACDAAGRLSSFRPARPEESGSEAAQIRTAARYLKDFMQALIERPDLVSAPDECPLRPLAYSVQAALDEYLDLAFPHRCAELEHAATRGEASNFYALGLLLSDYLGRLMALETSPARLSRPLFGLVSLWSTCWKQMRGAPAGARYDMLEAQAKVVERGTDGLLFATQSATNLPALEELARQLSDVLVSPELQAAKPPASGLAPLKLAEGRLWERISELAEDRDAAGAALEAHLEACRLLMQHRYPSRSVVEDVVAGIWRLKDMRRLDSSELGHLELARGNLAFRNSDWNRALAHHKEAALQLKDAVSDTDRLGIQNLTLIAARAHGGVAEVAMRLGDRATQVAYLTLAAEVLEDVASCFKVEASRNLLQQRAHMYRLKADLAADSGNA